jgi:uncharacterized phage protein gp47/JayE
MLLPFGDEANMLQRFLEGGNVVIVMAKVAAAVAFLSLLSVNWLSHTVATYEADKDKLSKLASSASRQRIDPATTGSLGKRAEAVRLDPCSSERRN